MKLLACALLLTACAKPAASVDEGRGPAIVMLHCLGCNLHYWDAAAADLARDHRVVRINLGRAVTIEGLAREVRDVLDRAGVDRFVIVGHSVSGTIALEIAKEIPNRVAGVVPVDSVLDVDAHVPPAMRAAIVEKTRTDYNGVIVSQLTKLMPPEPNPAVLERVHADALAADPARTAMILDSLLAYREDEALDRLRMPIIAIDADLRPLALAHNRAHAPQFDARIVPGTGHWLMLEKPAEFNAALRSVVTTIERNGTGI